MSTISKESKHGCIISKTVESFKPIRSQNIDKNIACLMKDGSILKGTIRLAGKINESEFVYGIELDSNFPFTTDDDLKNRNNWNYRNLILVKQCIDFIEIDDGNGTVKSKIEGECPGKYDHKDLVLVKIRDRFKAAYVRRSGTIEGMLCYEINLMEKMDGKYNFTVLEMDIVNKMLDETGCIIVQDNLELEKEDVVPEKVGDDFEFEKWRGTLQWQGRVNGCPCVGLYNEDYDLNDFSKLVKKSGSFWSMIPVKQYKENDKENQLQKEYSSKRSNNEENADFTNIKESSHTKIEEIYERPLPIMRDKGFPNLSEEVGVHSLYICVHSMFVFTEIFDQLIFDSRNKTCQYLAKKIVVPLRRNENVDIWTECLQKISLKLTDDVLEKVLEIIDFKFRMFDIKEKNEEKISLIDLSDGNFETKSKKNKIMELLNLYCIEQKKLILYPPKCFIIQLPLRKVENIPLKLDITKLTVSSENSCSVCSSDADLLCTECSKEKEDIIYFCKDHKTHCKHTDKLNMDIRKNYKTLPGKIELELVSVLCKDGHYNSSYIKTLNVNKKWTNFSIEKDGTIKFNETSELVGKNGDLEKYASICVYKFAPLEYYWGDF